MTEVALIAAAYLAGSLPFGYSPVRLLLHPQARLAEHGRTKSSGATSAGASAWPRWSLMLPRAQLPRSRPSRSGPVDCCDCWYRWRMLGHGYPVLLGFRGGKGGDGAGAALALFPAGVGIAALAWAIVFLTLRYVSVASLVAARPSWWPRRARPSLARIFRRAGIRIRDLSPPRQHLPPARRNGGARAPAPHLVRTRFVTPAAWMRGEDRPHWGVLDRGARVKEVMCGAHSSRRDADRPGCAAFRPASSSASSRRSNPTSSASRPRTACSSTLRVSTSTRARGRRRSASRRPAAPRQRAPHRRAAIFERRYGVKLTEALDLGGPRRRGSRSGEPLRRGRPAPARHRLPDARPRPLADRERRLRGLPAALRGRARARRLRADHAARRRRGSRRALPRPAGLQRRLDRGRLLRHLLVQRIRLAPLRLRPPGDRAPRRPRGRLRAQLGRRARRAPQRGLISS